MKWEGNRESDNVEDRRGGGFGGGRGLPIGGRGIGLGTVAIALVAGWIFGINPLTILGALDGSGGATMVQQQQVPAARPPPEDKLARFVSTVLADTEDVWGRVLAASNARYDAPRLVLYSGRTPTACGGGDAAMGPFYCPGDRKVYLDLDFFRTLQANLGAPGDFAQAYVIAHEVGHHLQQLMGVTEKVDRMRGRLSEADMNRVSVRVELQADCLAGVWTHHSQKGKGWLEQNDIPEALNAASKIGDDTLQRQARGTVVPDSFTHGSSEQRVRWFKRGLEAGQVKACDTFSERTL